MKKNELNKLRKMFLSIITLLVVSAFVVPYLFLDSYNTFWGAFFYWTLFALIVIYLTIKITAYWRD